MDREQDDIVNRLREYPGSEMREAVAEIERLRGQLPAEMQSCTIVFHECSVGHGWLTATNWIPHHCPTCEIERLRGLLDVAYDHLFGLGYEVDGPTLRQIATGTTSAAPNAATREAMEEAALPTSDKVQIQPTGDTITFDPKPRALFEQVARASQPDVALDAARYRWLRENGPITCLQALGDERAGARSSYADEQAALDADIDAQIARDARMTADQQKVTQAHRDDCIANAVGGPCNADCTADPKSAPYTPPCCKDAPEWMAVVTCNPGCPRATDNPSGEHQQNDARPEDQ
jgi:hypothetical protein